MFGCHHGTIGVIGVIEQLVKKRAAFLAAVGREPVGSFFPWERGAKDERVRHSGGLVDHDIAWLEGDGDCAHNVVDRFFAPAPRDVGDFEILIQFHVIEGGGLPVGVVDMPVAAIPPLIYFSTADFMTIVANLPAGIVMSPAGLED